MISVIYFSSCFSFYHEHSQKNVIQFEFVGTRRVRPLVGRSVSHAGSLTSHFGCWFVRTDRQIYRAFHLAWTSIEREREREGQWVAPLWDYGRLLCLDHPSLSHQGLKREKRRRGRETQTGGEGKKRKITVYRVHLFVLLVLGKEINFQMPFIPHQPLLGLFHFIKNLIKNIFFPLQLKTIQNFQNSIHTEKKVHVINKKKKKRLHQILAH